MMRKGRKEGRKKARKGGSAIWGSCPKQTLL
jgi:hypothetical protein